MRPVIWTRRARHDRGVILDLIRQRNSSGAERINNLVRTSIEKVAAHPHRYREGREPGTRKAVVHPNYIFIYAARDDAIHVPGVLHSRQQYP